MFIAGIKGCSLVHRNGDGMKSRISPSVFIVVKVHSGVPIIVEAFKKEASARKRAKALHRDFNLDYDAIETFRSPISRA